MILIAFSNACKITNNSRFLEFCLTAHSRISKRFEKLLIQAIEIEIAEYIEQAKNIKDEANKRLVTRNGHLPETLFLFCCGIELWLQKIRLFTHPTKMHINIKKS
jgi:hypothetical protein